MSVSTPSQFAACSAFQRDLLWVLADGPQHGLAVKKELERYYPTAINHGRLYPNLDALVRAGFVAKSNRDGRSNEYELTDRGWTSVRERLDWQSDYLGRAEQ